MNLFFYGKELNRPVYNGFVPAGTYNLQLISALQPKGLGDKTRLTRLSSYDVLPIAGDGG